MSAEDDQGWPKEGDVVMCTVQKVEKFGAFVSLDEYEDKEGFIHISEVSPNWVKNIRDFFKEGRKVVVKVMRIDRSKRHIDLSRKRTTEQQKRYKLQQWKQRQKVEKLLELVAKRLGKTPEQTATEVVDKLTPTYPDVYSAFEDVVATGKGVLTKQKIPKAWIEPLFEVIMANIELPTVSITGVVSVQCYAPNGVEVIRGALKELAKPIDGDGESEIGVQVIGPPRYRVTIQAEDYKIAEALLQSRIDAAQAFLTEYDHTFEFSRSGK
jgi:translation initiation factor 2 subunit 1